MWHTPHEKKEVEVPEVVINSERDAFDLLKKALSEELGPDFFVRFQDWPRVQVTLKGPEYHSTITPSLMQGLLDLQQGINRTYAQLVLDQPNAKNLKEADKQELEFKAKVEEGSSVVTVDLSEFAQKLVTEMVGRMDPSHVVILGVVGATLWAATTMYKHYANAQLKKKEINVDADKLVALSKEETARLELVTRALTVHPRLSAVEQSASATSMSMLKGISDADVINLNGVSLTQDEVRRVLSTARSTSNEIQINGNYRILSVDTSKDDEFRIKVRFLADGREFIAKFRDDSLDGEHVRALQQAEWGKSEVYLSVNATELRGEVTTATIVSATQQPIKS
ncbi:hypothetical protein N6G02_01115 [Cupriavidus gilardii]|uniref:hypothetical protein n=1 Tax=Cupriavidus gilardii TaxID=82541 RepID=UPI0021BF65E0|nr:hypothetical protein [Cupriavidus gilardii]MCT9114720.1 hypothetical protein [Cupriavidus gilardii]